MIENWLELCNGKDPLNSMFLLLPKNLNATHSSFKDITKFKSIILNEFDVYSISLIIP